MIIAIVVGVVIFGLVFAIAAGTIGRETHRLAVSQPAPSFELSDAVVFISERLPPEVSATLSYEDVRDLVGWHLDLLQSQGLEQKVGGIDELVIVDERSTVDALVLRGAEEGRSFEPSHVAAVLDGELAYLEEIGAVGPLADPDETGETGENRPS
jgi:hypothetical protein